MRYASVLAALALTVSAVPVPDDAASASPFDDCAPQAAGYAPPTRIPADTPNAFAQNPLYTALAVSFPPFGYQQSFFNAKAATTGAGYQGFSYLTTYNTTGCAALCNAQDGCEGFNVYIERDPTLNPAAACPNPPSTANFKCSLWSVPVTNSTATNSGQEREQFQVVVTGSNGYNKVS